MKVQKALHLYAELDKKRTKVRDHTYLITEKYDGWMGYLDVNADYSNSIMSRQQRVIPSLLGLSCSINDRLETIAAIEGRFIFEILILHSPEFKDLNGILNRSKGDCEARKAYLRVHDYIPLNGEHHTAEDRYGWSQAWVARLNHRHVKGTPLLGIGDVDLLQEHAETVWERGGEGAIGKRTDAGYSAGKRNLDILKVKCEVTLDLLVVGIEEGTGKYAGTIGALVVRDKAGVLNKVSGMSDEERDLWWTTPTLIINQVVEVQAMQILDNGSLREGRMKAVRHDKLISEID